MNEQKSAALSAAAPTPQMTHTLTDHRPPA
jgi:hypothetical protein